MNSGSGLLVETGETEAGALRFAAGAGRRGAPVNEWQHTCGERKTTPILESVPPGSNVAGHSRRGGGALEKWREGNRSGRRIVADG